MTAPGAHHANLRGELLLMEVAYGGLGQPHAFYLPGAAKELFWHDAPVRLFLLGLYERGAMESYLPASRQLFRAALTPQRVDAWLVGERWPEEAE